MTSRPDPSSLLGGHAGDSLSPAERRELYTAALLDQQLFDRLVEEESWRRLVSSPGVREQLLAALDEPAPASGGIFGWLRAFRLPPLAMGAAAAALVAVVLVPRWLERDVTGPVDPAAPVAAPPTELVAKSYAPPGGTRSLEQRSPDEVLNLSYVLELNQPEGPRQVPDAHVFGPGDQFRLRLGVDFTAWAYLFNRAAGDAEVAVLYPHTAAERRPLTPTERDVLLPAGVWLTMDDTPADEELVLVVSTEPWPPASGRETIPAGELDAALARAESDFASLAWRRSEVDGRVRLTVEESGGLVAVLRLLGG